MAVLPVDAQLPPAVVTTPIAGFWRRLAAFAVDCLILGIPALLLGLALFRWAVSLGQAGRLIGFVVALLYFGLMNSRFGGGRTLGKRLFGIQVTDREGHALSPIRSVLRFLVIAIPYFLNGLWFDTDVASLGLLKYLLALLVVVVFGGLGAIIYLFVFNRRTRQSLHDLSVGSFVVRSPSAEIPPGLSTPRLHLIAVGCWLALVLIVAEVGAWRESSGSQTANPLGILQTAIKGQPGIAQAKVTKGSTTVAWMRSGSSTTSFLRIDARLAEPRDDFDALLTTIAGTVLDLYPDLLGSQLLIVRAELRFDFGIVSWSSARQEALDATAWREKLRRRSVRPDST